MKIVFFENFLLFVNALLEIRNYFQQIRYTCITAVYKLFKFTPDKNIIDDEKDFEIKMEDF